MKIRYYTIRVKKKDAEDAVWILDHTTEDYFAVYETRDYTEITFNCYSVVYIATMLDMFISGIRFRRV